MKTDLKSLTRTADAALAQQQLKPDPKWHAATDMPMIIHDAVEREFVATFSPAEASSLSHALHDALRLIATVHRQHLKEALAELNAADSAILGMLDREDLQS